MTRPAVSVVMPVLDRAVMLAESLASIAAQTQPPAEILVVDGGSTDGSQAIARRFPAVRLIELAGAGVPSAHNAGIAAATGDVVAFAASDDTLDPRALELHTAALAAATGCGMSVGLTEFVDDAPHPRTPAGIAGGVRRARVLEALAVRRRVVQRHGGFLEDLGPAADVEWLARMGDAGIGIATVDHVVVRKRLHGGNVTYSRDESANELLRALRVAVLRRRHDGR